jgi:hypothetical protein
VGYHDHVWGRWVQNDPQFVFVEASVPEDGFSLALGGILGEQQNTLLGIKYKGETIQFSGKQVKLNYAASAFDPETALVYPSSFEVEAKSGDYSLNMLARAQRNVPLLIDYPAPMPGYLVFQQVSDLQGILRSKEGEEYQFDARGFSGCTSHRLHPIYGKVRAADAASLSNVTVAAKNLMTGQEKIVLTTSDGWFSIDADYADYLANSTAPWVADGDRVRLETGRDGGGRNSTIISIDLGADKQEANL